MKTKLSTLAKLNENELRKWLRKIWAIECPNTTSEFKDVWENKMWSHVRFKKDPTGLLEAEDYFQVRDAARRITYTQNQPPYQAINP
jgi:hypothetical protein